MTGEKSSRLRVEFSRDKRRTASSDHALEALEKITPPSPKKVHSTQAPRPPSQAQIRGDRSIGNLLERAPLPGYDRPHQLVAEAYAPKRGEGTNEEGVWYYARLAGRPAHAGL